MHSLDLFSGIGGCTLALHSFGITPKMYCEIDCDARGTLQRLMKKNKIPTAPIHDDVRTLEAPQVDMVIAGFPCLGFSPLGKKQGLHNQQSNLVHDVIRLAGASGARIVFLENHKHLVTDPKYEQDLQEILRGFREQGFEHARYVVMHGWDVGCPQTRMRAYILLVKGTPDPLTYTPGKPFSWKRIPCPMSESPIDRRRVKQLGNSVVPDLTRLAFLLLWTGCQSTDISVPSKLAFQTTVHASTIPNGAFGTFSDTGERTTFIKPVAPYTPPTIIIDPRLYTGTTRGKVSSPLITCPVTKLGFPTLTTGQTSGCHILTRRSSHHLVTMLRFLQQTPDHLRSGRPSIHFYEWLMGFPKNWTA